MAPDWNAIARTSARLAAPIRSAWLLAGATLLCIALVEGLAAVSLWLLGQEKNELAIRPDRPTLWFAETLPPVTWSSYVYWRGRPYSSEHAHVDERGLRRTWNPAAGSTAPALVFVFGGSTAWGPGARDEFTIPSLLSKELARDPGLPIEVKNFGQGAYVNTQELIALMLELQKGNVPDVAVFYDGVNDVFATYQNHTAGLPHNEAWRRLDFDSPEMALLYRIAGRSRSVELVRRIAGPFFASTWKPPKEGTAIADLARDTVDVYAHNLRIAEGLSKQFGFAVLYYWQPVVWSKKHLSPYEQTAAESMTRGFPHLDVLYREVYARVGSDPRLADDSRFRDLSRSFDAISESIFWDYCHVTETGNAHIAKQISRDVGALVAEKSSSSR